PAAPVERSGSRARRMGCPIRGGSRAARGAALSPLKRPVFVVGCPRSGTTLVQCILSASSHAFSLPETHFFSEVAPDLLGRPDLSALDEFIEQVEAHRPDTDTARTLRAVEKTPRHVLHLDTIDACFPDALFINVVRDPIDVASSLRGVPWEPSRSVV